MKKFTIQDVQTMLEKDCYVFCFPYETAGLRFDDPIEDRDENTYSWDYNLHKQLSKLAGVSPDNKTIYAIMPRYGTPLYVEFWDNVTVLSDKMFIRDSGSLFWGLKLQMMAHINRIMMATGFSFDQMKNVCDEAIAELKRWK